MDNIVTKLQFPPEFFKREERCGHVVGELIKRVWAAELEMLAHVDEICQKYGLTYFAFFGTLLGAIRHGGFVPWDDDMDIAMKREDYNKFLEVAAKELPEGYVILNNYEEEWDNSITKITNSHKIDFGNDYMKRFHNCPFAVGIDIFPLDNIPRDDREAEEQKYILTYIGNLTTVVLGRREEAVAGTRGELLAEYDKIIAEGLVYLQHMCGVQFDNKRTILQQLYILYDQVAGLYAGEECNELTNAPKYLQRGYSLKKEWLQSVEYIRFEVFKMPVACGYDEILRKSYKNYMIPRKYTSTHGDIYIREQLEVLCNILDARAHAIISEEEEQLLVEIICNRAQKKDGTKRKIIMFSHNTLDLLVHDGIAIRKIRYALNGFKNSEEILVLWRLSRIDEPQMDELMKLVPQMVQEYRELVKEAEDSSHVVLDKGITMRHVLELCDAYYGDENDISKRFQAMGKPVMIENYTILGDD